MKTNSLLKRVSALVLAAAMSLSLALVNVSAESAALTSSEVSAIAQSAGDYLAANYAAQTYSADAAKAVQYIYRSGSEQADAIVADYLAQATRELDANGAALYASNTYDENWNVVGTEGKSSLMGTLCAAWIAKETGDSALSARFLTAAEGLAASATLTAENCYNLAASIWLAGQIGGSDTMIAALTEALLNTDDAAGTYAYYYSTADKAFYYYGYTTDSNAVFALGLLDSADEAAAEAALNAVTYTDTFRQSDGGYFGDNQWTAYTNADSTGLALAAHSEATKLGKGSYTADQLMETYTALMSFYNTSGGYFEASYSPYLATEDALEGLLQYASYLKTAEAAVPTTSETSSQATSSAASAASETASQTEDNASTVSEASAKTGDSGAEMMAIACFALLLSACGAAALRKRQK